jgi:hypothetical protein
VMNDRGDGVTENQPGDQGSEASTGQGDEPSTGRGGGASMHRPGRQRLVIGLDLDMGSYVGLMHVG